MEDRIVVYIIVIEGHKVELIEVKEFIQTPYKQEETTYYEVCLDNRVVAKTWNNILAEQVFMLLVSRLVEEEVQI